MASARLEYVHRIGIVVDKDQRASFSRVIDDWLAIFGPSGEERQKEKMLAIIERAFDGVPVPGPKHLSLYQAQATDDYECRDQARDHKGRWQDLPREQTMRSGS